VSKYVTSAEDKLTKPRPSSDINPLLEKDIRSN